MARGWESKSVEEQIASAKARESEPRIKLTPEQLEVEKKRDSLLLHRTRVVRDLEACQDPRYRKQLESGLAYLDSQLAQLAT
ncbi:MAG TPA: hypothetical protein VNX18_18660 [Bryobacteraceae bacterium]|nr:hypothetical protein [Bryobacteraceae bacterium]